MTPLEFFLSTPLDVFPCSLTCACMQIAKHQLEMLKLIWFSSLWEQYNSWCRIYCVIHSGHAYVCCLGELSILNFGFVKSISLSNLVPSFLLYLIWMLMCRWRKMYLWFSTLEKGQKAKFSRYVKLLVLIVILLLRI